MTDTEAQPPTDPSASQPTQAPIGELLDLDAIETDVEENRTPTFVAIEAATVSALVAEVRRLRARVENHYCGGRAAVGE